MFAIRRIAVASFAAAAALQVEKPRKETVQSGKDVLPAVPEVLDKPSQVLQELNSQLSKLKAHLAESEQESRHAVADQKAKYEASLAMQRQNTSDMRSANKALKTAIKSIKGENTGLREQAGKLQEEGTALRKKLVVLQANLSTAQEFLETSLQVDPDTEEKTAVLRELDAADSAERQKEAHVRSLKKVGEVALLQLDGDEKPNTLDYVQTIAQKFDDLEKEQETSMQALEQQYNDESTAEAKVQADLMEEQAELMQTKESEEKLREQLQQAVTHLLKAKSFLEEQVAGLQSYTTRLGH